MKFCIKYKENFKTIFGVIISVLYCPSFLTFFLLFGLDFLNKNNPNIVSQVISDTTENKTIELSKNNIFFFSFRLAADKNNFEDLNLYGNNFGLQYYLHNNPTNTIKDIPIRKCTEVDFNFLLYPIENKDGFLCANL
jgi:hypothetical protein